MAFLIKIDPSMITSPQDVNKTICISPTHDASRDISYYKLNGRGYGSDGTFPIPSTMLLIKQDGIIMEYEEYIALGLRHMRVQLAKLVENGKILVQVTNPKTSLASAGSPFSTTCNVNEVLNPATLP